MGLFGFGTNNNDDYNDPTGPLAMCKKCNTIMGYSANRSGFKCHTCGLIISETQYYANDFDYTDNLPIGCQACGGPYPQCKTSCKLFDD